MKKNIICLCVLVSFITVRSQSIAINTDGTLPDSKAILDIKSTTKGLLVPRMTTAQRNAIGTPPNGLLVFDTNLSNYFFSSGGIWNQIGTGSNTWSINNLYGSVYYNGPTGVSIGTTIPYSKFHVNGTSWFQGDNTPLPSNAGQGIAIGYGSIGYIYAYDYLNDLSKDLILQHPGGNVGIGTTAPIGRLHIIHPGPTAHLILEYPGINDYSRILFSNTGTSYHWDIAGKMGNFSSDDRLNFYSSRLGADVMSMAGNGNIGIGTSAPAVKLHINGNGELLRLSGPTPILGFYDAGGAYKGYVWYPGSDNMEMGTGGGNVNGKLFLSIRGTPYLTLQNNGQVKIGNGPSATIYPWATLNVIDEMVVKAASSPQDEWMIRVDNFGGNFVFAKNGTSKGYIRDDGDYYSLSDKRLKENIASYKTVLEDVEKLRISTYHFKSNNTAEKSLGLIAQDVAKYFPEIVSKSVDQTGNTLMSIAYGKTGVIALKAIQEQQVIIESQQKKIDELERRLAALEKK